MRLSGMAKSWQSLCETRRVKELSFSEGLEILLHGEQEERQNNRYDRLLKEPNSATRQVSQKLTLNLQEVWTKGLLSDLSSCQYIDNGESILITGATGCGKSFWLLPWAIKLVCMVIK
ncbi:MAG: ATP-binding protein [Bacteroidales bacterium]